MLLCPPHTYTSPNRTSCSKAVPPVLDAKEMLYGTLDAAMAGKV